MQTTIIWMCVRPCVKFEVKERQLCPPKRKKARLAGKSCISQTWLRDPRPKSWYKYKRYIHPNNIAFRTLANATKADFTGGAGEEEADAPH